MSNILNFAGDASTDKFILVTRDFVLADWSEETATLDGAISAEL